MLKNNHGMTLVEVIIGIVLLAIVGTMLATSFASTTKIMNLATTYKIESSNASSALELNNGGTVVPSGVDKLSFYVGADKVTVNGKIVKNSNSGSSTGLTYKEFFTTGY